jgi:hypothetical protein
MQKLKSGEVSEVVSRVDPSILQELRDEIAVAKSTADEAKKDSADAKDAASDAERDAISGQDAASDAKNVVDSVKSSILDNVSGSSAIDSEAVKRDVRCIKYEMKKLKAKVKSIDVSASTPAVDPSVLRELRDEIAAAKSVDARSDVDSSRTSGVSGICGFGPSERAALEQVVEYVASLKAIYSSISSIQISADVKCLKYEVKKLKRSKKIVGEFGRDVSVTSGDIDDSTLSRVPDPIPDAPAARSVAHGFAEGGPDDGRSSDLGIVDVSPGARFPDAPLQPHDTAALSQFVEEVRRLKQAYHERDYKAMVGICVA